MAERAFQAKDVEKTNFERLNAVLYQYLCQNKSLENFGKTGKIILTFSKISLPIIR